MLLDAANEWMNYLGHFHPVVVHLPIGILFVAFILEIIARRKPVSPVLNDAILIILAAGFISAVLSCMLGWFLSMDGGYEETTLALHQWMGIAVAAVAALCWAFKKRQVSNIPSGKSYKISLITLFLLLMLTGHFGGSMTHGDDYLTAGLPQPVGGWFGIKEKIDTTHHQRKVIANIKEAVVFTDLVQPILDEKCYSCHSSKKIKGGLRLDDETFMFKGGKHGVVIKPGNADQSELMIRILLPKDDDKRMPPKDKKAITKDEIAVLHWWIQNGADTKKKVKDLSTDAAMIPVLAALGAPAKDTVTITPLSKIFDKNPTAAKKEDIDALTNLGIIVSPVAKNKNLLEISCINYTAFDNSKMPLLQKIGANIAALKMDNTAITDESLAIIAQFQNLVRLNLAGTNITGMGIGKLQALPGLEYLNVVGTKLNDESLVLVASFPSLKHIYCWNSFVTPKGIAAVKQKKPVIDVEAGSEKQ